MEARKINMLEWTLFGGGAVGESFYHINDHSLMLKLYHNYFPTENVYREWELAQAVKSMGIVTPEVGDIVTTGDRYGVIYHRIEHKKSFSRAISEDITLLEPLTLRFADICRKLHATECTAPAVRSYKEQYLNALKVSRFIPADQKPTIQKAIENLPEPHFCIHGDLHIANVITDGTTDYIIDLGGFAYGDPMMDVSMMYFVTHSEDPFVENNFHLKHPIMKKVWDVFWPAYFGEGMTESQVLEKIMPWLAVRSISMEVEADHTEPFLDEIRRKYLL